MSIVTSGEVRTFVVAHLCDAFKENNVRESETADDLDLMKSGIIDSIGLIQLIGAIEDHFNIDIDFEDLDTDDITVIGPLCRYIEARATKRSA